MSQRKSKKEKECTCEIGNLSVFPKNMLRYSMCDVCSEKLFSKNKIRPTNPLIKI